MFNKQNQKFMFNKITIMQPSRFATVLIAAILMQNFAQADEPELTPMEILEERVSEIGSSVGKLQELKVSGYIQTQFHYAGIDADGINFKLANRANDYDRAEQHNYSRFGVRRGRIKFTYEKGLLEGVFQPDITERGVSFKDAYLGVRDPWTKRSTLKAGVFDRPFGHEIAYSSGTRESPERSRIFQTLFPDERDLGVCLTLRTASTAPLNFLRFDGGLFAGNGIRPQFDNGLDFIGRLSASKTYDNWTIGGGASAYIGGQRMFAGVDSNGVPNPVRLYEMQDNAWAVKDSNNYGNLAPRQYFGVDFQFSMFNEGLGFTQLRAEYVMGTNPGSSSGITLNPTALLTGHRYIRSISGGYVILTQDIPTTPLTFVLKYDWYNPNTDISGNDIASAGEIALNNIGIGLIWYINPNLRLAAYYDLVSHETTDQIQTRVVDGYTVNGWAEKRSMDVLTVRLQYRF